ncbi:MAG: hypothetical protein ACFFE4_00320 [Candidatus Thorarchaeota archaeon]
MNKLGKYKIPLVLSSLTILVLILMLSIGFTIGFLSDNPDGLERVLIDQYGEEWLEHFASPLTPLLHWISNDYFIAILGIITTIGVSTSFFYFMKRVRKKKSINPNSNSEIIINKNKSNI